ncbi:MAG: hypothetical protein LBI15_03955 [Dysgonamonadaceae bacterium]|nr:hypothetical protein [Dysgonamonadaceae bacterium]
MRKITFLLCLIGGLSFSNCTTYYYSTVRSFDNQILQNEDGTFTNENNRISVTYSFEGLGGEIVYEINNQSDDPIFVDWSRSVLIAEDYAVQYRQNNARIDGRVRATTTTYRFSNSNYTSSISFSDLTGQIVLPQGDLFIPPRARISHSPLALSSVLDLNIPASAYERQDLGLGATASVASFSEEDTPLIFRSYLTIVNDRNGNQTVFENTFYISEIIRMNSRNNFLMNEVNWSGDKFYIEVINHNAQRTGALIGVGALVVGAIIVAPYLPDVPTTPY